MRRTREDQWSDDTGCIKGFFEVEKYVENGIKTTNSISIFYALKSIMKVKLFLMSLSLFPEKFNFHYTLQGTKYAHGICSSYAMFNILFCFKKPFYAPCVILAPETPTVSVDMDVERLEAQQELIVELDHLLANFTQHEELTSKEYTPTGPFAWGLEF